MKTFLVISLLFTTIQLHAQQTLIIGVLPFNTPFTTQIDNKGHFYGFEISLMDEICKRMNAHCVYKRKNIRQLFEAVDDNSIDLAIGGIIITKQREKNYLFSLPYLLSYGCFLVLKDSHFNDINDLYDKKIGTLKGSAFLEVLQKRYGSKSEIITYRYIPDLLFALVNKKVDAIMFDKEPALYWSAKEDNLKILGKPIPTGRGHAIMTNKDNTQLIDQVNKAILAIESDGTYLQLYNDFF